MHRPYLQNSAVRKTIPQLNLAVIAIALFRDPMECEARLPVLAA
jgi:hypothetical protein